MPPTSSAKIKIPDFVAIDVETTGLEFKVDRIIEIGAVKFVDGKVAEEFSTFVNAGVTIPYHIETLTKISNDDIRNAPRFDDIAAKLLEFIGDLPLCGHQIEFDQTFINEELKRAGRQTLSPQVIDTALFSRVLLQHVGRFSLKHVCAALDITLSNAHRALHDAKASGEAALKLIPKLLDLPINIRRALAAFSPSSIFKLCVINSLGGARYGIDLDCGSSLGQLSKLETPEEFLPIDADAVASAFSSGGKVNDELANFTPREAQISLARRVANAFNASGILAAEAGTGTGKSLAYLVPAALHALENNCRVIVSTHTRNLQDQLLLSDLPTAAAIVKNLFAQNDHAQNKQTQTLRYTKLKGRRNYLCRNRFYAMLRGELGNLSPRERYTVLPLVVWSQTTQTGDIEEQTFFNAKYFYKIWNLISAEGLECGGRRCKFYGGCFLHRARQLAQTSHIVVINHALFYSDVCAESTLLGAVGSIVFDEAHHLESCGHEHLRTEFDTNRSNAFIDRLQNLLHTAAAYKHLDGVKEFEHELKNHLKHARKCAQNLLAELDTWALSARTQNNNGADYQIALNENSFLKLREHAAFDIMLGDLQNTLRDVRLALAAVKDNADRGAADILRETAQSCAEAASQLRADLQYLTAAKTDDHVFWMEGSFKKWVKLCGVPLDISELLASIWDKCGGGVVFTSATLAIQGGTLDYFKRSAGLEHCGDRVSDVIFKSPYGAEQTLFGAFRNCPEPDNPAFPEFVADVIASLHKRFGKNILVLNTSNAMIANVNEHLKSRGDVDRNNLLAQGISAANRSSMLEQFKENRGMILLGADSFWEGIDAPGEACEIVVIPRLPFQVPTHPLTQAMAKRMEERFGNSFFSYSVPEAIIKFRQGIGRLIRSSTDRGMLLVLDNRIVTKTYGSLFAKSANCPLRVFADVDDMLGNANHFWKTEAIV